jgi:flagellar motor switch protein FliG
MSTQPMRSRISDAEAAAILVMLLGDDQASHLLASCRRS